MKEQLINNNDEYDSEFVNSILKNAAIGILSVFGTVLLLIFIGMVINYLF